MPLLRVARPAPRRGVAGAAVGPQTRWLDFGCGNGGLVRWAREHGVDNVVGHETGWIASRAQAQGIPMIDASCASARAQHV